MENHGFFSHLIRLFFQSLNNYYKDNFDYLRFGKQKNLTFKKIVKDFLYKNFLRKKLLLRKYNSIEPYLQDFSWLYVNVKDIESKNILVELLCFKILGYKHVKLSRNNPEYWNMINSIEKMANRELFISSGFMNWNLYLYNLESIGYDVKLYCTTLGINGAFGIEQYAYKSKTMNIQVKPGEVVIDAGGCWGDTSIYFASKAGPSGRVYSFEFIPKNLEIFEKNLSLNPELSANITIVKRPLWETDNKPVYYIDNGPASNVSFEPLNNYSGQTETITIDNFIEANKIDKVSFIKMDIEGAELFALKGAVNTIRKFKPTLAISIYHSLNDFTKIPHWVNELNEGYKLYIGHYTIHSEETVLFAIIE